MSLETDIKSLTFAVEKLTATIDESNAQMGVRGEVVTLTSVGLSNDTVDTTCEDAVEVVNDSTTPPPPPADEPPVEIVEEVATADTSMITTFDALPEHHERPYPRSAKKRRRGLPETALEKILANPEATEDEKVELRRMMVEYMIGITTRSIKRLRNIETTTVPEAVNKAEAIRLDEVELEHWQSELPSETGTAPTPPKDAPAPPSPPSPPAPVEEVVDTRGCPVGFTLTDKAPAEYEYGSYSGSGWTDQQLLDDGLMVAVSTAITIDGMRAIMKELSATKPTEALTACIAKYGARLEEVAIEDYPALVTDMNAIQ